MLTTAEEDRLVEALPLSQTIAFEGSNYSYTLEPYWGGADHVGDDSNSAPSYPAIVFDWETQGDEDGERRALGEVSEIDPVGDDDFREYDTAGYDDELSITVAVEATHDANGVPPQVRGSQLTRGVWRYIVHKLDLNSTGSNGERPMTVAPSSSPTPARVDGTYRLGWSVTVSYVDVAESVRNTTDSVDYTVDTK